MKFNVCQLTNWREEYNYGFCLTKDQLNENGPNQLLLSGNGSLTLGREWKLIGQDYEI
jgi:hypothetical protein